MSSARSVKDSTSRGIIASGKNTNLFINLHTLELNDFMGEGFSGFWFAQDMN